jgi:NDP-sugar pyrophosphorylase family protein
MQAIILAGGRGERLLPFTVDRPKCLVEVAGQPLIAHQLRWLAGQGVNHVVVSCGYQWQRISELVGAGAAFGLEVSYAVEESPLGRGGGLRKGLEMLAAEAEPILACNGDVLTALPLAPMVRGHRRSGAMATLLLVPFVSEHGVVDVDDDGRISGFREKPALPYWLSGGVYLVSPDIRPLLPRKGDHETTTWPKLAREARLSGYRYRGFWQPVDSAKDVREAERRLTR